LGCQNFAPATLPIIAVGRGGYANTSIKRLGSKLKTLYCVWGVDFGMEVGVSVIGTAIPCMRCASSSIMKS